MEQENNSSVLSEVRELKVKHKEENAFPLLMNGFYSLNRRGRLQNFQFSTRLQLVCLETFL
jgi:hypothetical protein